MQPTTTTTSKHNNETQSNAIKKDAPFFTVKLGIKVLPCIVAFKGGVTVDRVVGFEELGGKDDFATAVRFGEWSGATMTGWDGMGRLFRAPVLTVRAATDH